MSPSARPMENVWKYPRPAILQKTTSRLRVIWVHPSGNQLTIADTTEGYRVLETSHPPTYYFPRSSILPPFTLQPSTTRRTFCEWKGTATYHDLHIQDTIGIQTLTKGRIWSYPTPTKPFTEIKDYLCFYCSSRSDATGVGTWKCMVDEDVATPQEDGSWVTPEITGGEKGFKGGAGTLGW